MRSLVALPLFAFSLGSSSALAQQAPMRPVPAVHANASFEVRAAPDTAIVRLGVWAEAADAKPAQRETSESMAKITQAIRAQGVPADAITTERMELQPVYDYRQNERPRIIGYRSSLTLRVEVALGSPAQGERAGKVVAAAVEKGCNEIQGIEFVLKEDEPVRLKAFEGAARKARERAQVLAKSMGVQLGALLEVGQGGDTVRPPQPVFMEARAMKADMGASVPVSTGELTITATVNVSFAISGQ